MASLGLQPDKKTREAAGLAAAGVPQAKRVAAERAVRDHPSVGDRLDHFRAAASTPPTPPELNHTLFGLRSSPAGLCRTEERTRLHDAPRQAWQKVPGGRMQPDSYPDLHLPQAVTSSRSSQTWTPAQLCRQR